MRNHFDLAIACSPNGSIERIEAPLLILQHGPALSKPAAKNDTLALIDRLRERHYQSLLLAPSNNDGLGKSPHWLRVEKAGDPIYDSLTAHAQFCATYKEALQVHDQKLITISSTWGPSSLISKHPLLAKRLLQTLPANEYALALVLHPYVWAAHGEWQIKTWFRRELNAGLLIIPHMQGWQATILASDCAVGDHGSVTHYAAALGIPTILAASSVTSSERETSIVENTMAHSKFFEDAGDVIHFVDGLAKNENSISPTADEVFPYAGQAIKRIRSFAYELLGIPEPRHTNDLLDIAPPKPISAKNYAYRTTARRISQEKGTNIEIKVYPVALPSDDISYDGMIIAFVHATPNNLNQEANILVEMTPCDGYCPESLFERYHRCSYVVTRLPHGWYLKKRDRSELYRLDSEIHNPAVLSRAAVFLLQNEENQCEVIEGTHTGRIAIHQVRNDGSDPQSLFV